MYVHQITTKHKRTLSDRQANQQIEGYSSVHYRMLEILTDSLEPDLPVPTVR